MKKIKWLILIVAVISTMVGCSPDDFHPSEQLLFGHWVKGTEHWRYNENHSGCTWDTADDVQEEEAQPFTWTLEGDQLVQYHKLEMSDVTVPKAYTIIELSMNELSYQDLYGNVLTFSKI